MDSNREFIPKELPFYQNWIRKVSGKEVNLFIGKEDWAMTFTSDDKIPEWFKHGTAWAFLNSQSIGLHFELERLKYKSFEIKTILLHETGHLVYPRIFHGRGGAEYLADYYAFRKASLLGLEKERKWLFHRLGCLMDYSYQYTYSKNYRIAYRMLRKIGISR